MEDLKLTVTPNEKGELIIRTGQAEPIRKVNFLEIQGLITAPFEWHAKRVNVDTMQGVFPRGICVVNHDAKTIAFETEIDENLDRVKIVGQLEPGDAIARLGINTTKTYSLISLYKALRVEALYFSNKKNLADLLKSLQHFEVETETKLKNVNDRKGTTAMELVREVKTKHDLSFTLELELFKGVGPSTIRVEVEFEPSDNAGLTCWLVADNLEALRKEIWDKYVEDAKTAFKAYPVIEL